MENVTRTIAVSVVVALALVTGPAPARADGNEAPGAPGAAAHLSVGRQTCSIRPDGSVRCWNYVTGDLPRPVALGTGRTATSISAGGSEGFTFDGRKLHTCVVLDDGSVKCWGLNDIGQLGLGDALMRHWDDPKETGDHLPAVALGTGRTATAVAAGTSHTCALLDGGDMKCWGGNMVGELGQGHPGAPGDQPGEMGDALPVIDLGAGRTATAITAGEHHTCALLDDGTVKCWGVEALLGLGVGNNSVQGRGDDPGEMGDALPTVDLGTGRTATAISAGLRHTCALLDDGTVKCWGTNDSGQLGLGDTAKRGDEPGEMGDALPAVDLGPGRTAVGITAADRHTCALLDDGTVKCWGDNDFGQLGQGDTEDRGDEPGELGAALPAVALGGGSATAVTAGRNDTCAVLASGAVKCWGSGAGATEDQGDEPGEMGTSLRPATFGRTPPTGGFAVDARIRPFNRTVFVGRGVHNATGRGQIASSSILPGQGTVFVVRIKNESTVTDSFQVYDASRPDSAFVPTFFSPEDPNVVQEGARISNVAPGATREFRLLITVDPAIAPHESFAAQVRVHSVGDARVVDSVKARVTTPG